MSVPRGRPEAIVRPERGRKAFDVERLPPSASLAEFVDYYWLVRWRVSQPYRQQVIPQPRVHIAAEDGRLFVHGVTREPFFRTLTGGGHVLGAAFFSGGFRPLLKGSLAAISGTVRTAADVLGRNDRGTAEGILAATDSAAMIAVLEEYLLGVGPEPDPMAREVTLLVDEAERRTDIVRAEQLAEHAGISLRRLQRLFSEYIGIGPKWVIQRFRLLEATAAAHSGERIDWAALAGRLGFSDQAHLTRVFTQVVGTPPVTYQRDQTGAR
ncbi:AraC family transcriptional regulator [Actinobacteria bacterium YIM 96077]|uniref:AraC family transcriptional regulator n=1 Tax=Phytoactinopolyspora halophila TaxID=1981511 RepID=A0A329QNC2_9ACTN|nr:helix-turn-helix domain-containing protein [Phytoactinopolyspora halophila]AYY15289.1 AraC family transcriptional regulator [Actinobacteria bacterium YIM 96077]RAW13840.1 AraC family transcriptional regulator [Phytoactinopolyspora halophila]